MILIELHKDDFTEEKLLHIYKQYKIEDFFHWWNQDNRRVMEVRIKNYNLIKEVAKLFKLQWSSSGVYVRDGQTLSKVIKYTRNKETVWYGIQPRKKNWSKKSTYKTYGSGDRGGTADVNVKEICYIFIDIDRVVKEGKAKKEDLYEAYICAKSILQILQEQKWNKKYYIICSGNGIQLCIALDIPIQLPEVIYDNDKNIFVINNDYEKIRTIIQKTIGAQIKRYEKTFLNEHPTFNVEIDNSCFSLSRVGALHATTNRKYETPQWRGLLELVNDGENEGLTDYILDKSSKVTTTNIFKGSKRIDTKHLIKRGELEKNEIVKMLLELDFPDGGINNTLWFQLKILLRDSNFDLQSKEFVVFYKTIQTKHNRTFSLNIPDKKYSFNINVINNYCIEHNLPLAYKVNKNKFTNLYLDKLNYVFWDEINNIKVLKNLNIETTIFEDIENYKHYFKQKINHTKDIEHNKYIYKMFLKLCINKYGLEKTKYLNEYVLKEYFQYS